MPPQGERSSLLGDDASVSRPDKNMSVGQGDDGDESQNNRPFLSKVRLFLFKRCGTIWGTIVVLIAIALIAAIIYDRRSSSFRGNASKDKKHVKSTSSSSSSSSTSSSSSSSTSSYDEEKLARLTGPYKLVENQHGDNFFDYYNFFDGPDSLGSAGFNTYVGRDRAQELNIANVTTGDDGEQYAYMSSTTSDKGPRESVRLEGKRRFNNGLFILDVRHMPAGCGQWPAFWLTDEEAWPDNGEIDILEGINNQTVAKTAMHTSDRCSMYAHVSAWDMTGHWDSASGIPNTWTGELDFETRVPADNCWIMAPHQWANQGCVAINDQEGTIGKPLNEQGGGVYVLEWDPANHYIRAWAFTPREILPANLLSAITTAAAGARGELESHEEPIMPEPGAWGPPYAYFAIGPTTGCSADHFKNMRIVFNLAFCGKVSGNKFIKDCPAEAAAFNINDDPVLSCNEYISSHPEELKEAYWKLGGVYVYERTEGEEE